MKNTIFKWNKISRKNVVLAVFFIFIFQLAQSQCTTTGYTVLKTNTTCSANGTVKVTIPTSTDCTGWVAELVKQGGGASTVTIPVTGGEVNFTSLGVGNYDLRLTNGTTSINYSGNPIAIATTYVDMTYSFSTGAPTCPNSLDGTVTATVGAGTGTGPFVFTLVSPTLGTITSTPQTSRTYTFTGLRGGENVNLAITDKVNGNTGCEITVNRLSYTTATQTNAGLAFNDGNVRGLNFYKNCSTCPTSGGSVDMVVNLSNVSPARMAKLNENSSNAKVRINGVDYPLTLVSYNASYYIAQYKYNPVTTGGPLLYNGTNIQVFFTDICGILTRSKTVYMPEDNFANLYYNVSSNVTTCATTYTLRIENFHDDGTYRSIAFCSQNTLIIKKLRSLPSEVDYYTDVNYPAEISPDPNRSNPLSVSQTVDNSIAGGRAEYYLTSPGKYQIIASDGCHSITRYITINPSTSVLENATVTEVPSVLQGTSALSVNFGTVSYKSPIKIKIRRVDGQSKIDYDAKSPFQLKGQKSINFPIERDYIFTDNVARNYVVSDLPLGSYIVELTNSGCPNDKITTLTRNITLSRSAEYAMLDGNFNTDDSPVKVNLGCLGSSQIVFNMGKNANVTSTATTELWTATPQGAPLAYVATGGAISGGGNSLQATFNNLNPGNYLVRVLNIYNGYSPAEESVNNPAAGPWQYSIPATIPAFTPIKIEAATVFCDQTNPNSGIVNVEITEGTVTYPLTFTLYSVANPTVPFAVDDNPFVITESLASLNIRSISFTGVPQGSYFVRVSTPCYSVDTNVTVSTVATVPVAKTNNATICQGSPATLSIFTTKNLYAVSWTLKNDPNVIGTGSSVVVSPTTTTTYTAHYQLLTVYGCSGTEYESDVTITVLPLNLSVDVTPTQIELCGTTGTTTPVTVKNSSTGFNYEVVDANGNSFTPVLTKPGVNGTDLVFNVPISGLIPGSHLKIRPTSSNPFASCTATLDMEVAIVSSPKRDDLLVTGSAVCPGIDGTITIAGTENGVQYEVLRSGASLSPPVKVVGNGSNKILIVPVDQLLSTSNTFTIRATATGCIPVVLQNQAIITLLVAPIANAGADFNKTCVTNPNGKEIGMSAVSGNSYTWTAVPASSVTFLSASNIANPIASPINPTEYTLTVTDANGCKATDKVSVSVNLAAPTVNLGADFSITCTSNPSGKTLGSTIVGATYLWSTPANANLGTTATLAVNPSVTTNYTLVATYTSTGCSTTDSVIATVDKSLPIVDAGADFTKTCVTNPSGLIIGAATIAGQTYSWSPNTNLSSNTIANPTANPSATTTYTLTATKTATGCTATDAVVVTVNTTVPLANAGADFTKTCISNATGATIGVAPITGISYSWSPTTGLSDATISNPNANPLDTTEYTLTTTNNASGCTFTDKVIVTVDKSTILSDAGTDFTKTCSMNANGKVIGTTAVSGATYSWSPTTGLNNTTTANPTASPMSSTSYTVTTTKTTTGCSTSDSIDVTVDTLVPSSLSLERIDQPNCFIDKGTIRINATGISTDSYSINGADYQTNPVFTNVLPNTYNITVKSATNGCVSNAIAAVVNPQPQIPSAPIVIVNGATTFCEGGYVDLEGPTPPTGDSYTYQWFTTAGPITDATTRIYRATLPETYTLVITNSYSCSSQASAGIQVQVNNNPIATINNGVALEFLNCTNMLTLTASVGASYQWSLDGIILAAPQGTVRTFTATTPGSYKVTVTENSGCVATSEPTLLVPPPTIQPTTLETCAGNTITLNSNITSFTDPVYQWKRNGVAITTNGNNANYMASQNGVYTLQVTERNNSSITSTSCGVSVTINPLPTITAGVDFTITCTTNTTGRIIGESPETGFSYSWSPSAGLSNATIANPIANPSSTTTYTLRKTNTITGCWSEATIVVTVNKTAPNAQAGIDFTKTCINFTSGSEIGVAAVSGVTYSWSPSLGLSDATLANPIANPSTTTTYTLTTTNTITGCTATDTVEVTVDRTLPVADAGVDFTKTCITNFSGLTIGSTTIAGQTYSWSPNINLSSNTIANPTANPSVTTTYFLTAIKTSTGCTATDSVIVTVEMTLPTVSAGSDFTITCISNTTGRIIGESPETGFSYSWSPSAGLSNATIANPIANPSSTTTYTLRKTNTITGCWSEATIVVTVNKTAPNAQAGIDFTKTCINFTSGKEIGIVPISGVTYFWLPTTGLDDPTKANPIANPTTTTTYTLTATNTVNGCISTDTVLATVDVSMPIANAGTDFTKTCATNPTGKLIGSNAITGVTYSWLPITGLSDATIANPLANPSATTNYTLIATKTATGCTASASVNATVNNTPIPVALSSSIENTCPLETVNLETLQPPAVNGIIYEWWIGTATTRGTQITNPTTYSTPGTIYLWSKTANEGCYSTIPSQVNVIINVCCMSTVGQLVDNTNLLHFAPADIITLDHINYPTPSVVRYVIVNDFDGKIKQINTTKPEFIQLPAGNYTIHALVFGPTVVPTGLTIGNKLSQVQPSCGISASIGIVVQSICSSAISYTETLPSAKQYALLDSTTNQFVQVNTNGIFEMIHTGIPHQVIGFNYTGTATGIQAGGTIAGVSATNLDITAGAIISGCTAVTTQIDGIIYNDKDKRCIEGLNDQQGLPAVTLYAKLLNSNNQVVSVSSAIQAPYYTFSMSPDLLDGIYSIILDDNNRITDAVATYPNSWKGNTQTFTIESGQIVEYLSNTANFVPMCLQSATNKPILKPTANLVGNTYNYCQGAITSSIIIDALPGAIVNWYAESAGGVAKTTPLIPDTSVVGTTTCYVSQTLNGAESDRAEVIIAVHALPERPIAIAGNILVGAGTSQNYYVVNSSSGLTYNWILPTDWTGTSSSKDITVQVGTQEATIGVTAISSYGCVSPIQQLDVRVVIEDDIEVYNSISPNGDGVNDIFRIRNIDFYPENTLSIYNRWGIEVFHVNSYGQNDNFFKGFSDGRSTVSRDVELPEGTYFYTLTYKNTKGIEKNLSGYLYIKQ